jgi:type IV pilus assembly protein PilA
MPRQRAGFTLIELLIVVVIIGILAAIAIPKFQNTKGRANAAALKSDLRNLATAEEAYFYDNGVYTKVVTDLRYSNSHGVTFEQIDADGRGWAAVVTHPMAYPLRCAIFVGNPPTKYAPAIVEGQVACSDQP